MNHISETDFPTRFGKFKLHAFVDEQGGEHIALVKGEIEKKIVPVRIHSKCLTGDTFGSLRCDCREQFETALNYIEKEKLGIFIYLDQEGRGIGLTNKIKAYTLQDKGMDTVEANFDLGFCDDLRDYEIATEILKYFKVEEVNLLTNNPDKIKDLEKEDIKVTKRIPLVANPTDYNEEYLKTKKEKLNHML